MDNKLDNSIKRIFVFSGEQKVLNYLLSQDSWKTAKETQKATGLSKAAVNFALNKLFKLNLIERDQKGKTYLYRIFSSYPLVSITKRFKILNNLINYLPLVGKLKPVSQKIILFGSAARGENLQKSDIDILVVTHNEKEARDLVEKESLNQKFQIITKTPLSFIELEKKDPVFFREVEIGIVLWEKEEDYGEENYGE